MMDFFYMNIVTYGMNNLYPIDHYIFQMARVLLEAYILSKLGSCCKHCEPNPTRLNPNIGEPK